MERTIEQAMSRIPAGWLYRFWNLPDGMVSAEIGEDMETLYEGGYHATAATLVDAIDIAATNAGCD